MPPLWDNLSTMIEKSVYFYNKNQRVVGTLHLPASEGRFPAVLILHGFTGNRMEPHFIFVKTSRRLAQNGIASLRIDFRGSGESEGEFQDMTVEEEISDAKMALYFLLQQAQVDFYRVGVMGLSMGGCVSACLAGREGDKIKSLVLWSAAYKPGENLSGLFSPEMQRELEEKGYLNAGGNKVGKRFYEELPRVKPMEEIAKFAGDILLIHGTGDAVIPATEAQECYERLKNRPARTELYIIEGADHVFSTPEWEEEVISVTVDWFRKTL